MFLLIDNYDSFVYNLAAYFEALGEDIKVVRIDDLDLQFIKEKQDSIKGLILSPGPKRPEDALESIEVLNTYQGVLPILGVCLGHQVIGHYYGGTVAKGNRPQHGKIFQVTHTNHNMFAKIPETFNVTRYHSLEILLETLPDCLEVTATSSDGVIMGVAHKTKPIFGVQYHPEALLTEYGSEVIQNFISYCKGEQL